MLKNEIEVFFNYECESEEKIKFKENDKIKDACIFFASSKGIYFDNLYFMFEGNVLDSSQYNKPLNDFINPISDQWERITYFGKKQR